MSKIPPEVLEKLKSFNESIKKFEDTLEQFVSVPRDDRLVPVDKVAMDLSTLFSMNSLYWSYLSTHGKNPRESDELSVELKRTKNYMDDYKKLLEKEKRPRYNPAAVGRFVKHALFELNEVSDPGHTGPVSGICKQNVEMLIESTISHPPKKKRRQHN